MTYLTASGVEVRITGEPRLCGDSWKVPCVRAATGGFHGWLHLHKLRPVQPKAKGRQ